MAGGHECKAGGMHDRGHAWQGACLAGGIHGIGHAWQGASMARGVHGRGTCMVGGPCVHKRRDSHSI